MGELSSNIYLNRNQAFNRCEIIALAVQNIFSRPA